MRIALLYEHPSWSLDLIARAHARDIDLTPIDVAEFEFEAGSIPHGFDLWVNRVNAMPSAGRPASIVAATGHILTSLELHGCPVLNGSVTHRVGGSKAAQAAVFAQLGLHTPRTMAIHRVEDALRAARRIGFPVLTKPNIGGSGADIVRHDDEPNMGAAIASGELRLGIDGTGVVQELIESSDGLVYRVEMLGSDLFYGTRQTLVPDSFNYCAADGCAVGDAEPTIEVFDPPDTVIAAAARVMQATDAQVAGVEYIIDAVTGEPSFYDFNPYSNFVSGLDHALGFNPTDRYLDFVLTLG